MPQISFLSAVTVSVIFTVVGLIVNLFLALVNYKAWAQSHRNSSSDKILFSLGISRFLMLGLSLGHLMNFFISPDVKRSVKSSPVFMLCWMFLDSSSLWFVTLLNVLYCVMIINFQHSVFLLLKRNLSPKTPRLLLACVLISAFTTLLYVVLKQMFPFAEFVTRTNGTAFDISESVLSSMISLVLISVLQFIINVTSASLLIHSLWRHIQKMQRNASSFWNPQTEAHVGAMKMMMCFLLLYVPCSVATMFYYVPTAEVDLRTKATCMILSTLYPLGHSVLIILTHPKLKTKAKKILCFNK